MLLVLVLVVLLLSARIVKNELGGSAIQQELKGWGVGGLGGVTME